jgi:hypothetical protein
MDIVLGVLWVVYFVPFAVAMRNDHERWRWILALNALLGWTGIGWLAALYWARHPRPPAPEPEPVRRRGHLRLYAGGQPPRLPVRPAERPRTTTRPGAG